MSEIDNLLSVIRKDWETIPNTSKALAVFSILSVWFISNTWNTPKSKNIFIAIVLIFNFLVFALLKIVKPYYLKKKYSFSGFMNEDYEVIQDGGIWFIVDHKRRQIRWVANMTTAIELGLRFPKRSKLEDNKSISEYLKQKETKHYKASRHILITGRPGE